MTTIAEAFSTAVSFHQAGRSEEAANLYRMILAIVPDNVTVLNNLSLVSADAESEALLIKAISISPGVAETWLNSGNILKRRGDIASALDHYGRALRLKPDFLVAARCFDAIRAEAFMAAVGHQQAGRATAAALIYRRILAVDGDDVGALNNLGVILWKQSRQAAAIACFRRALALKPDHLEAYDNLATLYYECGRLEEALRHYRRILVLKPDSAEAHSHLLLCLVHHFGVSPERLLAEHQEYGLRYRPPLPDRLPATPLGPDRPLRVGYLTGDFRGHLATYFIEPVLSAHDPAQVATICYSNTRYPDDGTERVKGLATSWRDIAGLDTEAVVDLVRADGVDLLVDLAGHSEFNRLAVFARKPAPVQATWLGYPATTGVAAIDYRIVDPVTDPEGVADRLSSEALVRLKHGFFCFRPPPRPEVGPAPCLGSGFITFGSFNYLSKITPPVLALWSALLQRVPGSRLMLKTVRLECAEVRQSLFDRFGAAGIAPGRIELLARTEALRSHFELYNRIDIALDPFPYNGTTTTCDALLMGVPVITLAGDHHAARVGLSLLSRVGLADLAAGGEAAYLSVATALAGDGERRARLRRTMRERLLGSSLCDEVGFTRRLEAAYRLMWRRRCRGEPARPFSL